MTKTPIVPPIVPFDNRHPDKVAIYPFPWPDGIRVVYKTDGTAISGVLADDGRTQVKGFAPHVEDKLIELYLAIYSEPDKRYTLKGEQVVFPMHVFDVVLFDGSETTSGHGDKTKNAFDEWVFDPDWPCDPSSVVALVLCHLQYDLYRKGSDTCDIWQRRASLQRGLLKIGEGNPYRDQPATLRKLTIAPRHWDQPEGGTAANPPKVFWRQVENCFERGFKGCMIIDVWQPYAMNGNAFQLITEEDFI